MSPQVNGQLRVGLAQINPTSREFGIQYQLNPGIRGKGDGRQALTSVVLPEMVLTGYPVEDLANRATFRKASKRSSWPH
jgi:NAD+ synthase (glutamine-hydrolysing)